MEMMTKQEKPLLKENDNRKNINVLQNGALKTYSLE